MAAIHGQTALTIGHLEASGDLSAAQFKCVTIDGNGQVAAVSATTQPVIGVLANKPTAQGQPCTVIVMGVCEVIAGAANIVAGDEIYVSATGTVTEVNTSTRVGIALENATDGDLFTALVVCGNQPPGTV